MNDKQTERVISALDELAIETPSWGFADTGTRFGKFLQDGAAIDINDKMTDAAEVHRYTGCCPSMAVHVLWDFKDPKDVPSVIQAAEKLGIKLGAVNPNVFEGQLYKYGSVCNRDRTPREDAKAHLLDSVKIAKQVSSRYLSLWFGDGSNYPGQANIRWRKRAMTQCLQEVAAEMAADQIMLVEYKPFEPAFYHTDLADWGMAYLVAKAVGPKAKVLVDTGHHYQGQNVEQIVAWLLDEDMLGGFHFNDRRYADDDLTLGSIDPYQVFRIFHEILFFRWETGKKPEIAYMIDQSHNDKNKIEATIQTVCTAQELYAKAELVRHAELTRFKENNSEIDAEECLRDAFFTDVRPALIEWRKRHGLSPDPLRAFRESGYTGRAAKERKERRIALGIRAASSYA
jgi:L-rhamnose isomerase / sugar isomerase